MITYEFSSEIPQALVAVPEGCRTLAVNRPHWVEFHSQGPEPKVEIKTDILAQLPLRCHCDQVAAIDVVDPRHCILTVLWKRALESGKAEFGVSFCDTEIGEARRLYRLYRTAVSVVDMRHPNVALVELNALPGYELRVVTRDRTKDATVLNIDLMFHGQIVEHWGARQGTKQDLSVYFEFDAILGEIERQAQRLDLLGISKHVEHVISKLDKREYTKRLLLHGLLEGTLSEEQARQKVVRLRDRLLDGPIILEHAWADINSALLNSAVALHPHASHLVDDINESAYFVSLTDPDWRNRYAGDVVAFVDGKFVDADSDRSKLVKRIQSEFPKKNRLVAKVSESEEEIDLAGVAEWE